jgi:branched-chain amino acid transport system permease protein
VRLAVVAFVVWTAVLAATPFVADNYIVKLATFLAMYGALALSWNFIGGYAGYPSFATAAFVGLGSYAGALLQNAGVPMVAAWLGASAIAAAFAAVLGLAILRMKGHYFAIGSIALVEILSLVASSWSSLTGGGEGLNVRIMPGGPDFVGRVFLYTMLGVMVGAFVATLIVDRSRLGFGLRCIQQNEDAANVLGVNTYAYKTAAFCLSAVFVGIAGAIYANWTNYIEPPDVFDVLLAVKPLVMALLGGLGTIFGPAIGALILITFEEFVWRNFLTVHAAALGLIIVVLVLFLPNGILPLLRERFGRQGVSA